MRNAWHALGMARAAEGVLVGVGLALVVLACALEQGLLLRDPVAWGLALFAGTGMGTSWALELVPKVDHLAREVDTRLRMDGAMFTAWEAEVDGKTGSLVHVLTRRVRERVRPAQVIRAALPNSASVLAVPLLGAGLLALQTGKQADENGMNVTPALGAVVRALQETEGLAQEELVAGNMPAGDLRDLAALTRQARGIAAAGDRAAREPELAGEMGKRLESLAQDIEEFASRNAEHSEVSRALDQATAFVDAALVGLDEMGVEDEEQGGAGEPAAKDAPAGIPDPGEPAVASPDGTGPDPSGPPGSGNAGEGAGSDLGSGELANGGADGTMVAPSDGADPPSDGPGPDESASGGPRGAVDRPGGVALDRSWPTRHATLAERWIEARRTRATGSATPPKQDSD